MLASHRYAKLFALIIFFISVSLSVDAQNCTVNSGVARTICASETLILRGGESDNNIATSAVWTQESGPTVIISDPNVLEPTVTGLESVASTSTVTLTFRITATCTDGSLATQTVTHTILPVTIADAGSDLGNQCPDSPPALSANTPAVAGETAVWSVVGNNSAGVTINSTSDPNSTISLDNESFGTSTLRWTITNPNGCDSFDEITITNLGGEEPVDAVLNNASNILNLDNCYSVSQAVEMNASRAGNGTGGQGGLWVAVSGPTTPSFSSTTNRRATVGNLREGTYVLRWEVDGPCATGSSEMTINVPAPTQDVTRAQIDDEDGELVYCDDRQTFTLTGNFPSYAGETVTWSQASGGSATINDPNSAVTTVTLGAVPSAGDEFRFNYTINSPVAGCTNSDQVTVSFIEAPTISITGDDFVELGCDIGAFTINYTESGGNQVQYRIISGPEGSSNWQTVSGGSFDIGFTEPGTYTVRVRNQSFRSLDCPIAVDDVNLKISETPTESNAGTNQDFVPCGVTEVDLEGNDPLLDGGVGIGTWYLTSGPTSVVFDDENDFETKFRMSDNSALPGGTYLFRWIIDAGTICGTSEDDVRVIIGSPIATPDAYLPGGNSISGLCHGTAFTMDASEAPSGATGTWTEEGSSDLTFADINDPATTVTGFQPSTTYTIRWTVENTSDLSCGTAFDEMTISTNATQGPPDADAGDDQCLAAGQVTVALSGSDPGSSTGTWSLLTGPLTNGDLNYSAVNSANTNVTTTGNFPDGTYVFEWRVNQGAGCLERADEVTVTVGSDNTTTADAGDDDRVCSSDGTITLDGNTVASTETGTWAQVGGPAGGSITDVNDPTTTVTGLSNGVYTFEWTVDNGSCPSNADSVQIEVSRQPTTPNAGSNQSVCDDNIVLAGNTIENGTGVWSLSGENPNTPTISDVNSPTPTVTGLITGTYTFTWSAVGGPLCSPVESSSVTITVSRPADAGSDQQLCDQTNTLLTGTANTAGTWSLVSEPGASSVAIQNVGDNAANITGMDVNGTYTFRYTLADAGSCTGQDTDDVSVEVFAIGDTPLAGSDQTACDATSFTLDADRTVTSGVGSGQWVVLDGPNTPTFTPDANDPEAVISNLDYGIYVLEWQISNGACEISDQVRIENFEPPTTAAAGGDQSSCGPIVTMAANTPLAGNGTWSITSKPGGATDPVFDAQIDATTEVTFVEAGDYTLTWTISNKNASGNGCTDSSDDVVITIFNDVPTSADAGADQDVCDATTTTVTGNSPTVGTGNWSLISEPSGASASVDGSGNVSGMSEEGDYVFRWTITSSATTPGNPCTSTDDVTVTRYVTPVANAGSDETYCQFESFTLDATAPTSASAEGQWSFISGPAGVNVAFQDDTDPNTIPIGVVPDVTPYVFRWTVTNGSCSADTDDVEITIIENVSFANAGADDEISTSTFQFGADDSEFKVDDEGTWSVVSQPATASIDGSDFDDVNSSTATVSNLVPGDYVFRWTVDNGGCTSEDEMSLTVLPVVQISVSPASIAEDGSTDLVYTFTSNGSLPSDYDISFDISGTTSSSDYSTSGFTGTSGTITMLANQTTATIDVASVSDDNIEQDETLILALSDEDEYELGASTSATGTILDAERGDFVYVLTNQRNGVEAGASQRYQVTLHETNSSGAILTNETGGSLTVTLNYQEGTALAADFSGSNPLTSADVDIAEGNTFVRRSRGIFDDQLIEGDENITAYLSGMPTYGDIDSGSDISSPVQALVIDNDIEVFVQIETDQDGSEGLAGASSADDISYTISLVDGDGDPLTNETGGDYDIDLVYTDTETTAELADFAPATVYTTNILIGDGETSETITYDPINDTSIEDENLRARISSVMAPSITHSSTPVPSVSISATKGLADATIDDGAVWHIEATDDAGAESAGSPDGITYTVSVDNGAGTPLTNDTGAGLTIDIDFSDTSADADDITTTLPSNVTIPTSASSFDLDLDVEDDLLIEPTETLTATISNQPLGTIGTASDVASITDNDQAGIVLMNISVQRDGMETGPQSIQYLIELTDGALTPLQNATGSPITADIAFTGTADTDDIDESLPTSISIPNGDGSVIVDLDVDDDLEIEEEENLIATISNASAVIDGYNGTQGNSDGDATATIEDNDDDNVLVEIVNPQDGEEISGGDNVEYTVRLINGTGQVLTNATGSDFTVDIAFTNTAEEADFDLSGLTPPNAFPTTVDVVDGQSGTLLSFDVVDDTSFENEDLTATISNATHITIGNTAPSTSLDVGTNDEQTAAIDDDAILVLASNDGTETPTDDLDFTATLRNSANTTDLTNDSGADVTATLSFAGGSGEAEDVTGGFTSQTVTIPDDGSSVDVITLAVIDDEIVEIDETIIGTLSGGSGGFTIPSGTASATSTIDDNDSAEVTIENVSGAENGSDIQFSATLNKAVEGGFTVEVSTSNGSATLADSDYAEIDGFTLSFDGDATEVETFDLNPTGDNKVEIDETVTVSMDNLGGTVFTTTKIDISDTAIGTITNDDNTVVTIEDVSGDEDGANITVTATSSNPVDGGFSVNVSTSDITAEATTDSDYTAVTNFTLSFSGTTEDEEETFTIDPTADTKVERDETLDVSQSGLMATIVNTANINITDGATVTINNDDTATITIGNAAGNEDDGPITLTATVDNAVDEAFSVQISTVDGTAGTGDSDYTQITSQSLNFSGAAGQMVDFTVSPTDDTKVEADETLTIDQVGLTSTSYTTSEIIITDDATVTINNDDTAIITIDNVSQEEDQNSGDITLTATLNAAVQGGLTVDMNTTNGTALTGDSDYTALSGETVTFMGNAGETQDFVVSATVDSKLEPDEDLTVTMSDLSLGAGLDTDDIDISDDATVTIENDDAAEVTIDDVTVTEGNTLMFTLTLDNDVQGDVVVDATFTNVSTSDDDYAEATQTITFSDGDAGDETMNVTTDIDLLFENDETFTVSLSEGTGNANSEVTYGADGTGTIEDNAPFWVITKSSDGAEGGTDVVYNVELQDGSGNPLTNDTGGDLTVDIAFNDAASEAVQADLTTMFPSDVDLPDGDADIDVTLVVEDDDVLEPTENLRATISLPGSGPVGSIRTANADADITDNDDANLTIDDVTVSESDGTATFTVTVNGNVQEAFSVDYASSDDVAEAGADYTDTSGTLNFPAGRSDGDVLTIDVPILTDNVLEADETYDITLSNSTNLVTIADDTGIGTITDDDAAEVTIDDVTVTEGNTLMFTLTLDNDVQGDVVVDATFTNVSTSDDDYAEATQTITFSDGDAGDETMNVTTDIDLLFENDETFTVSLSEGTGNANSEVTYGADGTGTIEDNAPFWVITKSSDGAEGGTDVVYNVELQDGSGNPLTNDTGGDLTVDIAFNDAASEAVQADLTTMFPSDVDLPDGDADIDVTLVVEDDDVLEPTENLRATISLPGSGPVGSIRTANADADITDNDDANLTIDDVTVSESDGTATFTVTVNGNVQEAFSVDYASSDDVAEAGADYTDTSGTLNFPAGRSDGDVLTIDVPILTDNVLEADETYDITLSNSTNLVTIADDTGIGTITDDDAAEVTIDDVTVTEGNTLMFTLTLDNDVQGDVVVDATFTNVSTSDDDYAEATQTITFSDGDAGDETMNVTTDIDLLFENDETFTVSLSEGTGNANSEVTYGADGTGTIEDNAPFWVITKSSDGAEGGTDVVYNVELQDGSGNPLTNDTGGDLTVDIAFDDAASEAVQADLTTIFPSNVDLSDGDADIDVTLVVADDDILEGDENLRAVISNPGVGSVTVPSADATIDDADDGGTFWEVVRTQNGAEDGNDVIFTVKIVDGSGNGLTNIFGMDLSVDIEFTTGSETIQGDFNTTYPTTAVISDGEKETVLTFEVATDTLAEGTEVIQANISNQNFGDISVATATANVRDETAFWIIETIQNGAEGGDAGTSTPVQYEVSLVDADDNELSNVTGADITADIGFISGSTAEQADLSTSFPTSVSLADEQHSLIIQLNVAEDDIAEVTEDLVATLSSASFGSVSLSQGSATATISDLDNSELLWVISKTQDGVEDGNDVIYNVALEDPSGNSITNGTGADLSVDIAFDDAASEATQDDLSTTFPTTVIIADGSTDADIVLEVATDALLETVETLRATISSPSTGTIATASADATITDVDAASVAIDDVTVNESDGTAVFTVTLTGDVDDSFTIDYESGDSTAISSDYTSTSGSVTFPDNSQSGDTQTISVAITDDDVLEFDEEFKLVLSNITGLVTLADTLGVGTILDDDSAEVTISNATASEGDSLTFIVTLDNAVDGDVVVDVTFSNVTTTDDDYDVATQTVTFAGATAGTDTIRVFTAIDSLYEGDETLTASLALGMDNVNSEVTLGADSTGTIDDNEPVWVIVKTQDGVEGGDDVIYTIILQDTSGNEITNVSGGDLTVSIAFDDPASEAEQADLSTTFPTTVTIPDSSSSVQVVLTVATDAIVETTETLVATIGSPSVGSIAVSSADATITDASNNPPIAVNDTTATQEGTPVDILVLDNDSDPNGDELAIVTAGFDGTSGATEQGGTVAINDNGTPNDTTDDYIVYTPPAGFSGEDTFTYTITDGQETDEATVVINVSDNNPPVAVNDTTSVAEGEEIEIEILANDSDPDNDDLLITTAVSQNGGTVTIIDGVLLYTPPLNFCGEDVIDYTICDPEPLCASAQVVITVVPDDTDGDGIFDFLETISADSDEDGTPNYQDLDSDNDGIPDAEEVIFIDACTIEFPDSDNDGLEDYFDADIVVFNSFTPDGDGVNDQWVIEDIESFPDNTVRLFNRWGNLIYEERGYNNQDRAWNAERTNGVGFGSDRVPDGTYFYVIDLGDGSRPRSGFVVIKR